MKKITGKVVSLVLALALVVTSFSANFAFAATKTVSGTVSDTQNDDKIVLVNGDSSNNKFENLLLWTVASLDTKEHDGDVTDVEIASISHVSGASLVKWKIDNGDADLTLKSTDKSGKEVLSVLYKGTRQDEDGNDITVKASKEFTVYVLDKDDLVIAKNETKDSGKAPDDVDALAKNAGANVQLSVYSVAPAGNGSAKAVYTPVAVTLDENQLTGAAAYLEVSDDVVKLTKDSGTPTTIIATVSKTTSAKNLTYTAKKIKDNKVSGKSDDKFTFKSKIEKKIDLTKLENFAIGNLNIKKSDGDTFAIWTNPIDGKEYKSSVKDTEVVLPAGTKKVSVDSGTITKLSGEAESIDVAAATISNGIEVALKGGKISINDEKSKVGDIKLKDTSTADSNGKGPYIEVCQGKVGAIKTTDCDSTEITIYAGSVGAIDSDKEITLNANNDDTAITTGKITAPGATIFADSNKIVINGIKASEKNGKFLIKGEKSVSTGTIDFDYRDTELAFGDSSDKFVATIAAPVNAKNGKISTENEDTDVTITGDVTVDTISVGSDSDLTFTGSVKTKDVDGDGTLTIVPGKLYITGSASSATLKLSGDFKVGTVVFKADSDTVSEDDFTPFGFTLEKSEGKDVDTFKVKTLSFAGLQINKTSTKIAKGYSETFTATAYPTGTALPSGSVIKWDLEEGSDQVFEVTTNGNTATVKVISYDTTFTSENTGVLKATLQDADGYDLDDYAAGKVTITALEVPEAVSDTTTDISVAKGASYTMKVTSATQPTVTVGTAGVFSVALTSKNGNDYFYKLTATGDAGKATGVYLNGKKIFVASVKASSAVCDTTMPVTVKGAYTFKVTADVTPTVSVGSAAFKLEFVSKNGNAYFYKITSAGAKGAAAGVYVNGSRVFVATVG